MGKVEMRGQEGVLSGTQQSGAGDQKWAEAGRRLRSLPPERDQE